MKILIFIIALIQASISYAQVSSSSISIAPLTKDLTTDTYKTMQIKVIYLSGYLGGYDYSSKNSNDNAYGTVTNTGYSSSNSYVSYKKEAPTAAIGVGHDFSNTQSLEFRYLSFGRLAIVNRVGDRANYFWNSDSSYGFKSNDNKTTIDLSQLELNYKWYYYNYLFNNTTFNGELSLGLGMGLAYSFFNIRLKDGDYHKSEHVARLGAIFNLLAVTYRINNSYLVSFSYNYTSYSLESMSYGLFGLQYYFN